MRSFRHILKRRKSNYSQKMTVKSSAFFLPEMAVRIRLVFNNRPTKTTWTGGISTGHGGDKMTRKRRSNNGIFQQDILPDLSRRQLCSVPGDGMKGNNLYSFRRLVAHALRQSSRAELRAISQVALLLVPVGQFCCW